MVLPRRPRRRRSSAVALAAALGLTALGVAATSAPTAPDRTSAPAPDRSARPSATRAAASWTFLSQEIARPMPSYQGSDGTFSGRLNGGAPDTNRYGQSMLGLGMLQNGLRDGDPAAVESGLRAVSAAVKRRDRQRNTPTAFENTAVATAYNLARRRVPRHPVFVRHRGQWESWLRDVRMLWLPLPTRRYSNRYTVDAVATLETLRTGLRSNNPAAVLGGQRAEARRLLRWFVNGLVPTVATAKAVRTRGGSASVLSDPWADPLAYQALCFGYYARAVKLLGRQASPDARRALRRVAHASWALTGPDGMLAYSGRSQEQSWAITLTAYGAEQVAALPGTGPAEQRRMRALAERALARLRDAYRDAEGNRYIVPALRDRRDGPRGLDHYAGAVNYHGLTLVALNWALEERRPGAPVGALAADVRGPQRLSRGRTSWATVRTRDRWFSVKQATVHPWDMRYDFGLTTLKTRAADGTWRDTLPLRPITNLGHRVDSAGPLLRRGGRVGLPDGRSLSANRSGSVRVRGGFRTMAVAGAGENRRAVYGDWLRQGVTFRYEPVDCGVRIRFEARAGDRLEYSAFFTERPRVTATTAEGGALRVEADRPADIALEPGYASGVDPRLVRARLRVAVRRSGPVSFRLCDRG